MTRLATSAALAALVGWLSGCAGSTPAPSSPPAAAPGGDTGHEHGAHEHGEHSADVAANLAKLSIDDRTAAEKQRVCPVSDEPLGSMGTPIKMEVNGKSVFICCDGCREKLMANSERFLEKLE